MKIILSGITSFRNHGVEALVTTTLDQLRRRLPGSHFLVLDRVPEFDASRVPDKDVQFHYDHSARPFYSSRVRQILVNLSNYVERIDGNYQGTVREIKSGSAVVASGGDVFASEYGHRSCSRTCGRWNWPSSLDCPTSSMPSPSGPFRPIQTATLF